MVNPLMTSQISRREVLKAVAALGAASAVGCSTIGEQMAFSAKTSKRSHFNDPWTHTFDRTWLGNNVWANPMEDWQVKNGAAEVNYAGGNRSIHALTHQLKHIDKPFLVSVLIEQVASSETKSGASIRLGIKSEIDELKSNCFVQEGFDIGIIDNALVIGSKQLQLEKSIVDEPILLTLVGTPKNKNVQLRAIVTTAQSQKLLGDLDFDAEACALTGNIALVSNFNIPSLTHRETKKSDLGGRFRFSQWQMQGDAFLVNNDQKFGPILWSMYSLSDSRNDEGFVMKLSAFTGPLGKDDNRQISLQIKQNARWVTKANEDIHPDGWVATFRIPNWEATKTIAYRVVYDESLKGGKTKRATFEGSIRANPSGRPLKMAALTCQNDYAYPYQPVADNVKKLDPDLVFFSGDQIYETHGGYGVIREPSDLAILNYLRKYYQFGWAFREVMRDAPTICLPDDHDVLQGNLWGEGGLPMQNTERDPSASILSGYIEPVRVVNAVHRTCVGHHPDAYDPTTTPTGLSVYFGDMVYGDVSFAILADRQWKSGPERLNIEVGKTGEDEDPFYLNPNFNPTGLELLGERQESFLRKWATDWRGHTLKAVLSQTVFAGIATHQPRADRYLKYDFDSSGWPARARDKAIEIMRESKALHICGDTHLGSLSQYGVYKQRDSNWAFCTPAIAAGWPRWWLPDKVGLPHSNRPSHGLQQTGEYLDSFGNKIYIYAIGNPQEGRSPNRYQRAHEKGSGFGLITFDTVKMTYTMDAYKFLINATDGSSSNHFEGWPVTIHQEENAGNNRLL
ncbi:MAG: hypothetical protein Alis3KO_28700 [Aliiglaciecola sp.]